MMPGMMPGMGGMPGGMPGMGMAMAGFPEEFFTYGAEHMDCDSLLNDPVAMQQFQISVHMDTDSAGFKNAQRRIQWWQFQKVAAQMKEMSGQGSGDSSGSGDGSAPPADAPADSPPQMRLRN